MSCKMNDTLLSMYSTCKWELEPCQSQICTGCCDGKNIANTTCPVFDWHLHILWKHLCCHAVQSNILGMLSVLCSPMALTSQYPLKMYMHVRKLMLWQHF